MLSTTALIWSASVLDQAGSVPDVVGDEPGSGIGGMVQWRVEDLGV